jgi:predicted transposase YbfD/YdcC
LVSAVAHGSGGFQGQVQVDSKSNEIPAARQLIRQIGPLDDILVTTDAAHTQVETAQEVVMNQGADYLSPIKGNQPSLLRKARRLLPVGRFSPLGA